MPVWSLIVWLVIGGAAGFLAQRIMGGRSPGGLLGDLVLGILGAIVGGYGLSLLGISGNGGLVATFIVALVGALALLWLVRQFKKGA
ncbi:MAG: GlsB/YeaQ/YmgE family stress response membrane protein [Gammaproteobacteria bacterium]|nr:GlsB/YeaQ/YmgE family stress response membrane protein [Gammaproteobacteria bacterium]